MVFCVEADNRIVSCKAVFDNQSCNRSLRIHGEEHIVSYTKADDDVDIGHGLVQKPSLKEGRRDSSFMPCEQSLGLHFALELFRIIIYCKINSRSKGK